MKRDDSDFQAEIEAHIEIEAERLIAQGIPVPEAQAAARRAFGNVTGSRETFFEATRWVWWEDLVRDVRYALRSCRHSPWTTGVIVLSLALSIAANTAVFSVVHVLLLRELPYQAADRLLYVTEFWPHEPVAPGPPSIDYGNWRDHSRLIDGIAAYGGGATVTLTGNGNPSRLEGTMVTAGLLGLIGAAPLLGRNFPVDEDRAAGPPVVILGYGLWQKFFGGSKDALGKSIVLNGTAPTIVGILPPGFAFPDNNFRDELLLPMVLPSVLRWTNDMNFRLLRVMVRAKPGVSADALRQEFLGLLKATASQEPAQMETMRRDMGVRVYPLREWLTRDVRTKVLVLAGSVLIVLLIACLNAAGLQVARAIQRRREIALRIAIGAGRGRLVRQFLTESLLLSLVAALAGWALAYAGVGVLRSFLPANLHLADSAGLNGTILLFTTVIALLAGLVTGLAPCWIALQTGGELERPLRRDARQGSAGHLKIQSALIVAEISAATVLLVGAGLLVRTFVKLSTTDPGFDPRGVLTAKFAPSPHRYPDTDRRLALYRQALERISAIPGVERAAISGGIPVAGTFGAAGIAFEGRVQPAAGGRPSIPTAAVSTSYFQTLAIPILRGRAFTDADRDGAPRVSIVDEDFAQEFFPGQEALGKRIEVGSREGLWREIVGVARSVSHGRRPAGRLVVYTPLHNAWETEMYVILKSKLPAADLTASLAAAMRELDPSEPLFDIASMEDRLSSTLAEPRSSMVLLGALAGIAVLLAAAGVFGIQAYFVTRRTQEIGIRMALGARSFEVLAMVLARGMKLAAIGIALGIAAALLLTRSLGSLLEGIQAYDPLTFLAAASLFGLISALACLVPARWASRVDPLRALRHD